MAVRVSCPHCRQAYDITTDKLGKNATCKKCSQRFTLRQDGAELSLPDDPPLTPTEKKPAELAEPEKKLGLLERLQSGLQTAKQKLDDSIAKTGQTSPAGPPLHPSITEMTALKFITGPADVKPNTGVYIQCAGGDIVLWKLKDGLNFSLKCDEVLRISLASVKHLEIETAERMSMGRVGAGLLLAGPLGAVFGGFGFKKKDRLLRIDFDDVGMEASLIMGGGNVQAVNNKIMTARRDVARAQQGASQ